MAFSRQMETVMVRTFDGRLIRQHIAAASSVAFVQERRDDGDRTTAYIDTGERDEIGQRIFHEPAPALRR